MFFCNGCLLLSQRFRPGLGRSTVKYYADKEREKEIECPADAGTYYIAVDVEDGDSFTAAEKVFGEFWSYTILKAAAPDLSELTNYQKSYSHALLTAAGSEDGIITLDSAIAAATQAKPGLFITQASETAGAAGAATFTVTGSP